MTVPTDAPQPGGEFPLGFTLPEGFHELDLSESPECRAERLNEQLERTLPDLTVEQTAHLLLANQFAVEQLVGNGAVFAANFLGRSDRDETAATTAQLVVMTRPEPSRSTQALEVVLEGIRNERAGCDAQFVDLPVGRCLAVIEDTTVQTDHDAMGNEDGGARSIRQLQVIVPLPSHGQLAFFSLSTECLRDWDDYVVLMAEIAKSIRPTRRPGRVAKALGVG